jgi:hypothetical protein
MAEDPKAKSLEMRVAAIEDKLAKLNITEEEMKTYEKVSSLMGGGVGAVSPQGPSPQVCTIARNRQIITYCWRSPGIIQSCECSCGPCIQSGGGGSGFTGGFGGFGQ